MKYIVLECLDKNGIVRELPFLFPEALVHSEVANLLSTYIMVGSGPGPRPLGPMRQVKTVAAGFFSSGDLGVECTGRSNSLNVASRGEADNFLMRTHDYLHGIQ